ALCKFRPDSIAIIWAAVLTANRAVREGLYPGTHLRRHWPVAGKHLRQVRIGNTQMLSKSASSATLGLEVLGKLMQSCRCHENHFRTRYSKLQASAKPAIAKVGLCPYLRPFAPDEPI